MLKEEQARWERVLRPPLEKNNHLQHMTLQMGSDPSAWLTRPRLRLQPHWSLHVLFLLTRKLVHPSHPHPLHLAHLCLPSRLSGDVISSQEACSAPCPHCS